jgi:hypothetical protein
MEFFDESLHVAADQCAISCREVNIIMLVGFEDLVASVEDIQIVMEVFVSCSDADGFEKEY